MSRKKTLEEQNAEVARLEERLKRAKQERDKTAQKELERIRKKNYELLRELMDVYGLKDEKHWAGKIQSWIIEARQSHPGGNNGGSD